MGAKWGLVHSTSNPGWFSTKRHGVGLAKEKPWEPGASELDIFFFFFFSTQDKHSCFLFLHQLSPFCLMQFKSSPVSSHLVFSCFLLQFASCTIVSYVKCSSFLIYWSTSTSKLSFLPPSACIVYTSPLRSKTIPYTYSTILGIFTTLTGSIAPWTRFNENKKKTPLRFWSYRLRLERNRYSPIEADHAARDRDVWYKDLVSGSHMFKITRVWFSACLSPFSD